DISVAADVSRATLYQYFASKDDVFVELLDECGAALLEVMRAAGPLGPTSDGLDHLLAWINDWSTVHERYGALFVQWANVDLLGTSVRPMIASYSQGYDRRVAELLTGTGLSRMSAAEAAVVATSVVHRYNYLRFAVPDDHTPLAEAVTEIATVLQAILFPETPREALQSHGPPRPSSPGAPLEPRVRASRSALRLAGLTPRSAATVRAIMDAGARCFAEVGYHRTNVDEIVRVAGFARGTFYKHFTEKLDLLLVLADDYEDHTYEHIIEFGRIPVGGEGSAARREWVERFLDFRTTYLGVMRALIDRSPRHPELDETRSRLNHMIIGTLGRVVAAGELAGIVSDRAAEIVLTGVLERLPEAMADAEQPAARDDVVELIATVIERGLLGLDPAVSRPNGTNG
ncbi:MAG: putative TetR-family transcriptional regulator, partial [Aeromicrobium sp.]|nr:putative TetR-family transcriptional regulator [Aeromicrobium sp.]